MKVIIAGSRSIKDYDLVAKAIDESGFGITEVVSGGALGVDQLGEAWARNFGVPIKQFLPKFDPENFRSKWLAPLARNQEMADYGEALILIWDGESKGSQDMFKKASKRGIKIYVKRSTAG